jgi:hypothetical protein
MRLYICSGVLATLLYPWASMLFWPRTVFDYMFAPPIGYVLPVCVGVSAGLALIPFRHWSLRVPPHARGLFIGLLAAEAVALLSVALMVVMVSIESGAWFRMTFIVFIKLQIPALMGTLAAYQIANLLVERVVPPETTDQNMRS